MSQSHMRPRRNHSPKWEMEHFYATGSYLALAMSVLPEVNAYMSICKAQRGLSPVIRNAYLLGIKEEIRAPRISS